ncbi:23S rRNA (adenine(2503)-C(2))-methyltransferase RlmN [Pasteuria penetrans]|uniref:23S rRNA (adenine(2503)-C(2))-methyltransferase RlmN n=1 Tax=Pasteuria penetrans TaxID=86005 RepID=UPI0011EF6367|nr:23S rRNA (adenine(2503)-C(2))-methyltransferase RlmN [Pasteuria penetrans]
MSLVSSAYGQTQEDWSQEMERRKQPPFRAQQIWQGLYEKKVTAFADITNLPRDLKTQLDSSFDLQPLRCLTKQDSADGTVKFLFGLRDHHAIETVLMRHEYGICVCVTTQVGCRLGCKFCASALGGLKRNLTVGEIVAQVMEVERFLSPCGERVRSVVVMGMGEPMENYEAMVQALCIIMKGFSIGQRRITVSTSGLVPEIYRFTHEPWQVGLAISLHAPEQDLRANLMPIARRYPLSELMAACRYYGQQTRRRLTFEYALMDGHNDQKEHAHALGKLLSGLCCLLNLIPINSVPERGFKRTPHQRILMFRKIVAGYGIAVTIRREHGHDIDAACGQLRLRKGTDDFPVAKGTMMGSKEDRGQ